MRSQKAATSARGLGWCRNKSPPETEQSSAAYRNEAIAISARPVRPGSLGRVGQGRAKALGALRAQVVDRSGKEAAASADAATCRARKVELSPPPGRQTTAAVSAPVAVC